MSDHQLVFLPEEFTQAAAQHLAILPDVEVLELGDLTLELRVRGRPVSSELDNLYTLYRNEPDQLPALWQALEETLEAQPPDRSEDNPVVLLGRVLPMLKPITLLSAVREQGIPMLAYRPLVGDLMVTYVVDEGPSVAYLNEGHLQRWGIGETVLWTSALRNLRAKPWRPNPGVIGEGAASLLLFSGNDGYDATRLLLPELFAEFAVSIPGNLVIGVPNRDLLIAFSDADARIFTRVQAQVEIDSRAEGYPLTAQLFSYRRGELVPYVGRT